MPTPPRVAIVGTGFGGIAMAVRLLADGVRDVTLLERAEDTGGTWRDNTYPGAACDIPSHLYSLSFEPKADWSRAYAPQAEIRAYLDEVVGRHDLRHRTRFGFDVRAMTWDDTDATWTLTSARGDTVVADVVVNAIGGLKDPRHPDIPGLDAFEGPVLHTAAWDHDVSLTGRRVATIGTGASAIQLVPALAGVADELTVFQRTPAWVVPRGDRRFTALEQLAFAHVPGLRRAKRAAVFAEHELFRWAFTQGTPLHRLGTELARRHLRRQVPDPELRRRLTPDYPFGCKRVLKSDDYYPGLCRDDVTLETAGIDRVEPDAIITSDGRRVPVDVIALATGFCVDDPLHGTVVTGRDGVDLDAFWAGRPTAHLGVTVPHFPNMFLLLGPNAALAHNSVLLQIESAVAYVADAVRRLRDDGLATIEVTEAAHDRFVTWVDDHHDASAWSGCSSWYVNDRGENFTLWPRTTIAYRLATRRVTLADHVVRRRDEPPPRVDDHHDERPEVLL